MSNNKKLGTEFEHKILRAYSQAGAWVHFLTPDERGAQPFDIIAVKDGKAFAIECKTLSTSKRYFTIDRLETNQVLAFERWIKCGNSIPIIYVEYGDKIVEIPYDMLEEEKKIDMRALTNERSKADN